MTFLLDGAGDERFPVDSDVERVDSYIRYHEDPLTNQPVGKPLGPLLTTYATIKKTIDFVIQLSPNTADEQKAVQQQIQLLFADEAAPDSFIYLSHINEAISATPGETDHVLISPTANILTAKNEIAEPGTFTWK